MGLFRLGKSKKTIDLTVVPNLKVIAPRRDFKISGDCVDLTGESPVQPEQKVTQSPTVSPSENADFLNALASAGGENKLADASPEISEIKKILKNLTARIEDSSNATYRLLQRIELLERKIERFESRGA